MERGPTFYVSFGCGLVALVLFTLAFNYPAQLVFESRPYARVALTSGNAAQWTASDLGLDESQMELVLTHYEEFLRRNKGLNGDSSSDSSDSSDSEEKENAGHGNVVTSNLKPLSHHDDGDRLRRAEDQDDDDDYNIRDIGETPARNGVVSKLVSDNEQEDSEKEEDESSDSSDSSDSSESSDDDSSEESQVPLSQRLAEAPWRQTVHLGLFSGRMCRVMRGEPEVERCVTLASPEGIAFMSKEVSFMQTDVNMPMWNNLRVESLFSVLTCLVGMVCLLATLRPCCENPRLPVYIGSLAFFGSGVLVLMPMVRILLLRQDFERELQRDFNVTTILMTSWSLVISGLGIPFALVAGFSMIAKNWYKISRRWYKELKVKALVTGNKQSKVPLATLPKRDAEEAHETDNLYENMDGQQPLCNIERENKQDELLKSLK